MFDFAKFLARIVMTAAEQFPLYNILILMQARHVCLQLEDTLFGCATRLPATVPLICGSLLDLDPAAHDGGGAIDICQ